MDDTTENKYNEGSDKKTGDKVMSKILPILAISGVAVTTAIILLQKEDPDLIAAFKEAMKEAKKAMGPQYNEEEILDKLEPYLGDDRQLKQPIEIVTTEDSSAIVSKVFITKTGLVSPLSKGTTMFLPYSVISDIRPHVVKKEGGC